MFDYLKQNNIYNSSTSQCEKKNNIGERTVNGETVIKPNPTIHLVCVTIIHDR